MENTEQVEMGEGELHSVKELREHLKPLMVNKGDYWINEFSELKDPIAYSYRSQALDAAMKFFMSYYYGKDRRVARLGKEWANLKTSAPPQAEGLTNV